MTSMHEFWEEAQETLAFQFGPCVLGKWSFASLSNRTSPLMATNDQLIIPPIRRPTCYQQMRDDGTISGTLSFDRNAIRYIPYRGKRYFIDLSCGPFDNYLHKFSARTRNTLKRKIRRFAEHSGGIIDLRCYQSPETMIEFRGHAIAISRLSYQGQIGFGLPESDDFGNHLIEEAANGRVCGFVLMLQDRPVSYIFCRINSYILTYSIPGYDPNFVKLSPGTVLLYKVLEQLFADPKYRIFDFGGQAWDYKEFFATGSVDYLKVMWFPITVKNLIFVTTHYLVRQAWEGAAWGRSLCRYAAQRSSWRRLLTLNLHQALSSVRK